MQNRPYFKFLPLHNMANRNLQCLEDNDSSCASCLDCRGFDISGDARGECALFDDRYQPKRREKNGTEGTLHDLFGEDSDGGSKIGLDRNSKKKNSAWTTAPGFPSGQTSNHPTGPPFFQAAGHVNANHGIFNDVGGDQHISITTGVDPGTNNLTP